VTWVWEGVLVRYLKSQKIFRGTKPKVISEALGHSSVAFTMDVYSHIIDGMQGDAMVLLDEVLPVGKTRE
jgi:integrase